MSAISVYITVPGWEIDPILRELMATRARYATAMAGTLGTAGYELVPTGRAPHFSLVLARATGVDAAALLAQCALASESLLSEEVRPMSTTRIEVDIPFDVQDEDELGMPYALLTEARDPNRIVPGAIVVTADDEDPVLARVHTLAKQGELTIVHLELLPGDPRDYEDALRRSHLLPT